MGFERQPAGHNCGFYVIASTSDTECNDKNTKAFKHLFCSGEIMKGFPDYPTDRYCQAVMEMLRLYGEDEYKPLTDQIVLWLRRA